MTRIRPAIDADVDLILEFIQGLAEYEKLAHACVATAEQLRKTLFGPRPYAECLIAEFDGRPAGFALYFFNYSTFLAKPGLYLEDLFVLPELRAQGIGKELFRELIQIAKARECGRVEWSVLDWNEPAQAFYRRIGAAPVDGWHVWRLDPAKATL